MIENEEDLFYNRLGERIRQSRTQENLHQEALAGLLGLTRASVINIEKGRQRPSIFQLLKIAQFLKLDYTQLIPVQSTPSADATTLDQDDYDSIISGTALNEQVKHSFNQFLFSLNKKK